ncbi:hypothetical protein HX039_18070, partial [Myroides marinus]|uniref:MBG domain-containing protein n=1 Tax=Myroides marinus TaxID=703342 RepID=UPI0025787AF0
ASSGNGGGIYSYSYFSSSFVSLTNSEMNNNTASSGNGGGIYSYSSYSSYSSSSVSLLNSNMIGNKGNDAVYYDNGTNNTLTVHNSIIYGNIDKNNTVFAGDSWLGGFKPTGANLVYKHSLVQGNVSTADGNLNGTAYPLNDLFTDVTNKDYSLKNNSPLIDKGANSLYTGENLDLSKDSDIVGNPRLVGVIDIGAYESLCNLQATISKTDVNCYGESNGSAIVSVSGGTAPYTYSWAPSGGTAATATGLAPGNYTVTVTDANACTTTASVTIDQPTAPLTTTTSKTDVSCNGESNGTATVTATGGTAPYTYSWAPSGGTAATATGLAAGTYTVTVTDANACTTTASVTIDQPTAPLTTTTSKTDVSCNGESNGTATVTATGGTAPYTYSWAPSGGTAATATGLAAGTYTVTITDANACTTTVTATITEPNVVQAPKVTSNSVSFKYGDSATALVATNDANHTLKWYEGDNKTLLTKVPIPITNKIGKQTYWVSQVNSTECESELVKIEVTITPATLTVTADAQSKVYGSVDSALTYQVTGIVNAEKESDVLSGNLSRDKGENVGSYLINQGTLIANGNYTMTFAASNLTITPASLTVIADAQSKVYGSADPALTYKVSGIVNAEKESAVLSGSLTRDKGENVRSYAISQGTLVANSNYMMTFAGRNLTITPATLTVTADAKTKVYGSADLALTYQVTGLVNAEKESDVLSGNLSRDKGENVGSYLINQGTLIANGNYTMTFTGSNLTITPAALTVTADAQSKVYGSVDPTLTYKVSGIVNAEKESAVLSGSLTRDKGENVRSYAISQGSLKASSNYTLDFKTNNLEITQANLTVTADAKTKVYGSADPVLTYKVSGLVNAEKESVVLSGSLTRD